MKLINPTDRELNEAFAEHVALLEPISGRMGFWRKKNVHCSCYGGEYNINFYVTSVDAVLPWLNQWITDKNGTISIYNDIVQGYWAVRVSSYPNQEGLFQFDGRDKCLSRAAVIALLRAHKVEVEFTVQP